jgi:hypothetical protein
MRGYILAGMLVSLLPAFALAAAMPDHRSGMPAALSAIPTDASEASATTAPILVNLRSPTPAPESRFLIQPNEHSQPQAKTNDTRMASATRVHIYWFFARR